MEQEKGSFGSDASYKAILRQEQLVRSRRFFLDRQNSFTTATMLSGLILPLESKARGVELLLSLPRK